MRSRWKPGILRSTSFSALQLHTVTSQPYAVNMQVPVMAVLQGFRLVQHIDGDAKASNLGATEHHRSCSGCAAQADDWQHEHAGMLT